MTTEEDLPFRCGKCGAFVKAQRLQEADDYGPMPCKRCKRKGKSSEHEQKRGASRG